MMFLRRYIAVFLGLCDSVSKGRHKATTPNFIPQGKVLVMYHLQTCALISLLLGMVVSLYKQYE